MCHKSFERSHAVEYNNYNTVQSDCACNFIKHVQIVEIKALFTADGPR